MKFALVAGCAMAAVASAKPPLQTLGNPTKVDPVRVAGIKKVNGVISMTTEWMPYSSFSNRAIPSGCLFDDFGRDWSLAATGAPENNGVCLADGSRWFFGTAALNNHWQDDLLVHRNTFATEFDWGWSWNPVAASPCLLAVFAGDGDMSTCTPLANGSGFVLDYGTLAPGAGYYYSNVDLAFLGAGLTFDATVTSYEGVLANAFDGTTLTLAAEPCQPMLWGATNNLRADAAGAVMPGSYGDQGDNTFDDDTPNDGLFDPGECYTYNFGPGFCGLPLGKMVAFGGCSIDFDGDGFPTGDDFDAFVAAFELGDLSSDFDGDGFVTGDDFDAYVALFELGC